MTQGNKPELIAEFDCPACGSNERFGELLANEVKDKGWMRPELNFYVQIWQGAVWDELWAHKIPIGSRVPAYFIYVDVCLKCGCIYAAKLERGTGVKIAESAPVLSQGRVIRGDSKIEIPDAIKKAFEDTKPKE